MAAYKPTEEQQAIIDTYLTGGGLVVEAGAGAGKTSTLRMCAQADPRRSILYLAYNRSIADEARSSMPSNVRAQTIHSVAYREIGAEHRKRGREIGGRRIPAREVAQILGITDPLRLGDDIAPLSPQQVARIAMQTIDRFCKSGSYELALWHVPKLPKIENREVWEALAAAVLPYAQKAWADLCSYNGKLRLDHDHYLKQFQLRCHPNAEKRIRLRYDVIAVDEAQDLNPCVEAILKAQNQNLGPHDLKTQIIYVGDSCQSINGWNGAVNAMANAPGARLFLTQSFRFGPVIAEEANKWLTLLGAELRIRGFEEVPSLVGRIDYPDAVLCRTNAGAIRQVVKEQAAGRRVALVGGGTEIKNLAYAAIDLKRGRGTNHPELVAFSTWAEVQEYADMDTADSNLKTAIKLIDQLGPEVIIDIIDSLVEERYADVIISTAHKAKGREWDRVRVADDFPEPKETDDELGISREELMLNYVTVTRARRVLDHFGALSWVDDYVTSPVVNLDSASEVSEPTLVGVGAGR